MSNNSNSGIMFVISAPSGTGKSTIIASILRDLKFLKKPVSYTTRLPRPGEKDGSDYNFVGQEEFEKKLQQHDFIEWAKVYDNFYGTSLEYINKELEKNSALIKDIDTQGALQLKKVLGSKAVLIFIEPPSIEELENRIRKRGKDSEQVIKKRMECAIKEIKEAKNYDYRVINDKMDRAIKEIKDIVKGFIE